jgi:hypothetical protein
MVTLLVWTPDGHGAAVVSLRNAPSVFMHHPVMPMAKKYKIFEIGRSAMDPVDHMVSIAP